MTKFKAFSKGALFGEPGVLALSLLIALILLIFNVELDMNNIIATISSYEGTVNVRINDLPSLIAVLAGGFANLKKYNKEIKDINE